MKGTESPFRMDWPIWVAILALLLGIALVDRSFAFWRNDATNFVDVNGRYFEVGPEVQRTWHDSHTVQKAFAGSGVTLLLLSVVLFTRSRGASDKPQR